MEKEKTLEPLISTRYYENNNMVHCYKGVEFYHFFKSEDYEKDLSDQFLIKGTNKFFNSLSEVITEIDSFK